MTIIEALRAKQAKIINDDKSSVVIIRTSKTSDGAGGWTEATSTKPAQDMRIYSKGVVTEKIKTSVTEGGYVQTSIQKMLAYYNADINRKTASNIDTFTIGTKTYEVFDVINKTVGANVVFKECYIKEI